MSTIQNTTTQSNIQSNIQTQTKTKAKIETNTRSSVQDSVTKKTDELPQQAEVRFLLFDNFSKYEISKIIAYVKSLVPKNEHRHLVFAKKTEHSQEMVLKDLINDVKEDHFYLLNNPPKKQS